MIDWLRSVFSGTVRPLQDRLSALVSAAVAVAITLTGLAAYIATDIAVYAQLDGELIQVASMTSSWLAGDVRSMGGLNSDALTAANVTVMVVRSDNQTFTPAGTQPQLVLTAQEVAIARTQVGASARSGADSNGQPYRVVAVPLTDDSGHYALVLGRPLGPTQRIPMILAAALLSFGVAAVIVAAVVGTVIARSALAPVQTLTEAVRRVTETDELEPIELGGANELAELTRSFNQMMRGLASSREQQRRLVADASHELRTPLTALRTNVELLIADEREGMLPPGAREQILHDVVAQLGEFTTLVGDLVHLSREDVVRPSPEPIDLHDVVSSALERVKRRGPGLTFEADLRPFYLIGESDSLERAVTNLLDNAVKFSPAGGTIRVWMDGDRLHVADEGPGIAPEDLPHIFDRFYRSDKARSTPGSGLGLSIVAQTIRAHGGWVKAERAATGGAEFVIRLPGSTTPPPE